MADVFFASAYTDRRLAPYFLARTEAEVRAMYETEMGKPPNVVVKEARHPTVGERFRSMDGLCLCTSYDSRYGFWMEWVNGDRRNVSERAIGRTYHRIYEEEPEDAQLRQDWDRVATSRDPQGDA